MRTKEEIENMIDTISESLRNLPPENAFGDSNDEEREVLEGWLADLETALNGGEVPNGFDVSYWLRKSSHSALNDYE